MSAFRGWVLPLLFVSVLSPAGAPAPEAAPVAHAPRTAAHPLAA